MATPPQPPESDHWLGGFQSGLANAHSLWSQWKILSMVLRNPNRQLIGGKHPIIYTLW